MEGKICLMQHLELLIVTKPSTRGHGLLHAPDHGLIAMHTLRLIWVSYAIKVHIYEKGIRPFFDSQSWEQSLEFGITVRHQKRVMQILVNIQTLIGCQKNFKWNKQASDNVQLYPSLHRRPQGEWV